MVEAARFEFPIHAKQEVLGKSFTNDYAQRLSLRKSFTNDYFTLELFGRKAESG